MSLCDSSDEESEDATDTSTFSDCVCEIGEQKQQHRLMDRMFSEIGKRFQETRIDQAAGHTDDER